jgi:hypothetical protein
MKLIEKKEVFDMAGAVLTAISKDEHERAGGQILHEMPR